MERVPSGMHEIMDVRIVRPFSVGRPSSFSWLRKDVGRERLRRSLRGRAGLSLSAVPWAVCREGHAVLPKADVTCRRAWGLSFAGTDGE